MKILGLYKTNQLALGVHWSLLGLGIFVFYTWLTGAANYSGLVADDAIYLLMTERFNPNVENLLVHHYVTEVSHFPPLWPLLLSALDISSNNISKAHWVQNFVISLGVISIGLFSLRLKSGLGAASAIVVLSAASPATLLLSVEIWSRSRPTTRA